MITWLDLIIVCSVRLLVCKLSRFHIVVHCDQNEKPPSFGLDSPD